MHFTSSRVGTSERISPQPIEQALARGKSEGRRRSPNFHGESPLPDRFHGRRPPAQSLTRAAAAKGTKLPHQARGSTVPRLQLASNKSTALLLTGRLRTLNPAGQPSNAGTHRRPSRRRRETEADDGRNEAESRPPAVEEATTSRAIID